MAIAKEQIFTAADDLVAAGQKPTLEAVRQVTGGRYTTISPALNAWKARQAAAAAARREQAPPAVLERLAEMGSDIWTIALTLANARFAAERGVLETDRAELEANRNEATDLADKLAGEVETLQSRLASIEASQADARREVEGLRDRLAAVQKQAHTAEARALEIERRAGDLRAELDRAHEDADQARAALAEQKNAGQAATTQLDDARKEARDAREEAARLAGQLETHKQQAAILLGRLAAPAADQVKSAPRKKGGIV